MHNAEALALRAVADRITQFQASGTYEVIFPSHHDMSRFSADWGNFQERARKTERETNKSSRGAQNLSLILTKFFI